MWPSLRNVAFVTCTLGICLGGTTGRMQCCSMPFLFSSDGKSLFAARLIIADSILV